MVVPEKLQARLEDEVGDLFFVLVNIARYLSVDPESALRKTNRKFKRRFQWMEARLHESGRSADQASMEELESLWQQAKADRTADRGEGPVSADSIVLRRCHGLEELRACVALQKEVWNFTDAELVPLRMFVVADKVGGQVMGAFEGDAHGRLRPVGAGYAQRPCLSALAYAGGAQRSSQRRAWDGA